MIRFSKYIWVYILISSVVILPGLYALVRWGLRPSIDFTGGTVLEVTLKKPVTNETAQSIAGKHAIDLTEVVKNPNNGYTFHIKQTKEESIDAFQKDLETQSEGLIILKKDSVGPVIGKELLDKAVVASLLVILAILSYVAYAFKNIKFGVSAVVALLHDMLVMFTTFALLGHFMGVEVDTLFVTAFLTTMSFSVHDTIVIFDRIREYRKRDPRTELTSLSDVALTETMGRSLVNSFTIMFMLLALALMGGNTIRWFAVALLVGTITGTYSSPFVATPVLIFLDKWEKQKKH